MSAECTGCPGLSGWLNFPEPDEIPCGCGLIYDCCGTVIPVGCLGEKCMLFRDEGCKIGPKESNVPEPSQEFIYLHEFLFRRDLDENGMIYGFDFILDDPPPVLAEIPYVGKVEK